MRYLLATAAALPLLSGCSSSWQTFHANRITVRYPQTWFATRSALTPVTSPAQVLAVASYRLPRVRGDANGCEPKEALDRLPAKGALVFAWEYPNAGQLGRPREDFRRRPEHFSLGHVESNECFGPSYGFALEDGGRFFEIHVVLGRDATGETRAAVLRILDSFRAKPRRR